MSLREIINTVEELVGTYPDRDSLRNAISAITAAYWYECDCTKSDFDITYFLNLVISSSQMYEAERGISMTIGGKA